MVDSEVDLEVVVVGKVFVVVLVDVQTVVEVGVGVEVEVEHTQGLVGCNLDLVEHNPDLAEHILVFVQDIRVPLGNI